MTPAADLKNIEKAVKKIELSLSACTRKKLPYDEVQRELEKNYKFIIEEKLLEKLKNFYRGIPLKRKRNSLWRKINWGTVKITSDLYLGVMTIFLSDRADIIKNFLNDMGGQIIFCFYANCLVLYAEQGRTIRERQVQGLVERYRGYRFKRDEPITLVLPWGRETAKALRFGLLIEYSRLSKGWLDYSLHKTYLRRWKYDHIDSNMEDEIKSVLVKVPSFDNTRGTRLVSIENLDRPPQYWNWTCKCEDFIVHHHRKILVVCHHVAAVIWKLMDEGKIKKPWE